MIDLRTHPGVMLVWENQPRSSALYIKHNGRVIGIRANVDQGPTDKGNWYIHDCWKIDPEAPVHLGHVGSRLGVFHLTAVAARSNVDRLIASGELTMKLEDDEWVKE